MPCIVIVAGDMNIDLTKCDAHKETASYIESVMTNNFMPTILMPMRITSYSASLIDHIYCYQGNLGMIQLI